MSGNYGRLRKIETNLFRGVEIVLVRLETTRWLEVPRQAATCVLGTIIYGTNTKVKVYQDLVNM